MEMVGSMGRMVVIAVTMEEITAVMTGGEITVITVMMMSMGVFLSH